MIRLATPRDADLLFPLAHEGIAVTYGGDLSRDAFVEAWLSGRAGYCILDDTGYTNYESERIPAAFICGALVKGRLNASVWLMPRDMPGMMGEGLYAASLAEGLRRWPTVTECFATFVTDNQIERGVQQRYALRLRDVPTFRTIEKERTVENVCSAAALAAFFGVARA